MSITLNCPRCRRNVMVGPELAGSYVLCPHCKGQFWVPEEIGMIAGQGAADESGRQAAGAPKKTPSGPTPPAAPEGGAAPQAASFQLSSGSPPPPPPPAGRRERGDTPGRSVGAGGGSPSPAPAPPDSPPGLRPERQSGSSPAAQPPAPPDRKFSAAVSLGGGPQPQAPPTARRVARLITTDKSATQLTPAADGKLPELQLADSRKPENESDGQRGIHPLALLALLCASVVASIAMLLVEPGANVTRSELKRRARQEIETDYFANLNNPGPQEPYQFLLRDAQRAYAQSDYQKERELYRQVLKLLRAERGRFESVTGSRNRDARLEELLMLLLGDP